MCLQGVLALSDLTFAYRQILITSCPLSHLSKINVMVSFLVLPNEHKGTMALEHLLAFCINLLTREMLELRCVQIGWISAGEVWELSVEMSCPHLLLCVDEASPDLQI